MPSASAAPLSGDAILVARSEVGDDEIVGGSRPALPPRRLCLAHSVSCRPTEAAGYRRRLEAIEASGRLPAGGLRTKSHLLLTWVDEIVRHPNVLDAVESIVGPDILVWGTSFFIKEPRNASFVSWHQDLTYWGLEPPDIVTAWIALSESSTENGAMRVIPGTHTSEVVPHRDTFAADNLLSRGQEISVEVDEAQGRHARARARPDVAPPRQADPRLGAEPVRQAQDRAGDPLHPHPRAPDRRGDRQRHAGARRRQRSVISTPRSGPSPISRTRRSRTMPGSRARPRAS